MPVGSAVRTNRHPRHVTRPERVVVDRAPLASCTTSRKKAPLPSPRTHIPIRRALRGSSRVGEAVRYAARTRRAPISEYFIAIAAPARPCRFLVMERDALAFAGYAVASQPLSEFIPVTTRLARPTVTPISVSYTHLTLPTKR